MILDANARFLALVGYRLEDIRGQHHRMFCGAEIYAAGPEYAAFWRQLAQASPSTLLFVACQVRRIIWLEFSMLAHASYFPVRQADGQVVKVVKFASDVTDSHFALLEKPPCSPR